MAFHDSLLNIFSGNSRMMGIIGAWIGGAILVFIIMRFISNYNAENPPWRERSLIDEEGFRQQRRYLSDIIRRVRKEERAASRERAAIKASQSQSTERLQKKGFRGLLQGIKGIRLMFKGEDYETALTRRSLGITAAMQRIKRSLQAWSNKKKISEITEEQEITTLPKVMEELRRTINNNAIEATIRRYLYNFRSSLIPFLQRVISTEQENRASRDELTRNMDGALKVMKGAIQGAKNRLNEFNKKERAAIKDFGKEATKFRAIIKAKTKELNQAEKGGENLNLIQSLRNTIALLQKQLGQIEKIRKQIALTAAYMKRIVKQMRALINLVLKNEKQMRNYEIAMVKREIEAMKNLKKLQDAIAEVEKIIEQPNQNPFNIAKILARSIKAYLEAYVSLLRDDIQFEKSVADVNLKNIVIGQQMEAFYRLEVSLTQSSEAVTSGEKAIETLLSGIFGEEQQINEDEIIKAMQDSMKMLDYEGGVQGYMEKVERVIEYESARLNTQIQELIRQNEGLIAKATAEVRMNSIYLGRLVASGFARQMEVDQKVVKQADAFINEVGKHNNEMAGAASTAINLERKAPAT